MSATAFSVRGSNLGRNVHGDGMMMEPGDGWMQHGPGMSMLAATMSSGLRKQMSPLREGGLKGNGAALCGFSTTRT